MTAVHRCNLLPSVNLRLHAPFPLSPPIPPSSSSLRYGPEFASNGGGVFATLWDGNGIQTWFFPVSGM